MAIKPEYPNNLQKSAHDTSAHFAPALDLPRTPQTPIAGALAGSIRQGFAALKAALLPAKTIPVAAPPEITPVYLALRQEARYPGMTADNTVKHLQNGTAPSQIAPLEYLIKYLRQERLKTEAVTVGDQRVLRVEIPRWKEPKKILQKLKIYFPNSIAQIAATPAEIKSASAVTPVRPDSASVARATISQPEQH
jgi:hypothetical protein